MIGPEEGSREQEVIVCAAERGREGSRKVVGVRVHRAARGGGRAPR